jgi:hypothetical protein
MISFAVIRAQAFMRGRIARSKLTLEVTAATNIVSIIIQMFPFKLAETLLNLHLNLSLHCSNHAFEVSGILYVMS